MTNVNVRQINIPSAKTRNAKFGRTYRLTIDLGEGIDPIIIGMPLTIQFTVNRVISSSLNTCYIDIYNLSDRVRELIFQEYWTDWNKKLTLEAGYETVGTIYTGTITSASSRREGTNIITTIECLAGSFDINTTTVFETLNKGTTLGDMFKFLIGQYKGLSLGAVGDYFKDSDKLLCPVTLNGNVWDILKTYANNAVYIDNGRVYVMQRNETVQGQIAEISSESGILETPARSAGYVHVQTLFEPRIQLNQIIDLRSSVQPIYNGTYKVMGIQHTGIISDSVNGQCRTALDLFTGSTTFKTVIVTDES